MVDESDFSHSMEAPLAKRSRRLKDISRKFAASFRRFNRRTGQIGFWSYCFIAIVAIPTILAGAFNVFIASPQYVTEAELAVRAPDRPIMEFNPTSATDSQNSTTNSSRLKTNASDTMEDKPSSIFGNPTSIINSVFGTSRTDTGKDAFVVANFIQSRNLVREMDEDGNIRRAFSNPQIDFLSRLGSNGSSEELWKYWCTKVSSNVDIMTGIVQIRVTAFTPKDARNIAYEIIWRSENLVNEYSARIRGNSQQFAAMILEQATQRYKKALLALGEFRALNHVVDPIKSTIAINDTLLKVELERIKVRRERDVSIELMSPTAPSIQLFDEQIKTLNRQIDNIRAQLTSEREKVTAVSEQIGHFEELETDRLFAEKLYLIAQTAYERARVEAEHQQLYLVVFVPPTLPQDARYPRKIVNTGLVFFCGLLIWGSLKLIVASINDQAS